jgi:hypothetical protein
MPNYLPTQAANAARQKAANKHKIAQYIADHYSMTGQPLAQPDIIGSLKFSRTTVSRALRELFVEKRIKCVGVAVDTERENLNANTRMYGPPDAAMIGPPPVVVPEKRREMAYQGKPAPLAMPRVKTPKYRGEKGARYVPEFKPMEEGSYDLYAGRNLAMLAR